MTRDYREHRFQGTFHRSVLFTNLPMPGITSMIVHFVHCIIRKKKSGFPLFFMKRKWQLLFSACEGEDKKSLRDYALLELLYATGIRVSELTSIKMQDIDDHLGIVIVMGKGRKERYVPFGSFAQSHSMPTWRTVDPF